MVVQQTSQRTSNDSSELRSLTIKMITGKDMNTVFTAIVPLYVAMALAYASVKWWNILTPSQCGGINRFVSVFAIPLLSFQFISGNNPYEMNVKFVAADSTSKLCVLVCLGAWARYSRRGSFEWMITLFALVTLPNTLVMGTPLLTAMYGASEGVLTVQAVVLQSAIWYTLLLVLYEYRAATNLIATAFPETAAQIVSVAVDSDVTSLEGRDCTIQAEAVQAGNDGKLHVTIRRSESSKSFTPRASNFSGVEIYSMTSSVNLTPRTSSCNQGEELPTLQERSFDAYSLHSSRCPTLTPTPRKSSFHEETLNASVGLSLNMNSSRRGRHFYCHGVGRGNFLPRSGAHEGRTRFPGSVNVGSAIDFQSSGLGSSVNPVFSPRVISETARKAQIVPVRVNSSKSAGVADAKELHMFVWRESALTVADPTDGLPVFGSGSRRAAGNLVQENLDAEEVHVHVAQSDQEIRRTIDGELTTRAEDVEIGTAESIAKVPEDEGMKGMPSSTVMMKLVVTMTFRKLVWNPNTYSTLLGVIWSLVAFKWSIEMPGILYHSYHIISDAGLGMAMFSLGLFMGLGDRIIACGTRLALLGMLLRFLISPALFAAASYLVGIRGVTLKVCIMQAALPQGIVPFVFAKEYNVHPDIFSTAVVFGMFVALPVALLYYILLGL